ncbi:hypothetical protein [Streptomyces sp. NPDC047453]|uniref:hypothetical protein n=1 Tax=Streptomyces sp. NPDC047453 TaxID=3154812 RepID=UPI0033FF748E
MANRTDQPPEQPTPVAADVDAAAPELLARASVDYTDAQNRREQLSGEDRVHGNETGGAS